MTGLTNVAWLGLWYNNISDISTVTGLTRLTPLYLQDNHISDLSPLAGLTNLAKIVLRNNRISDISSLVSNTGLGSGDTVDVKGNRLSDQSLHTHIPALQSRGIMVEFDNRTPTTLLNISGMITELDNLLIVEVRDNNNLAFAGVPVTFTVTSGNGMLSTTRTTTDENGRAQSRFTLRSDEGPNTVSASVEGISEPLTFVEVPFVNIPFDVTNIPEPVPPPKEVRDFFQLDPYYQQWINVGGFPILASAEVSPYALKEAAWILGHMIGHRPDVLRIMTERTARFAIVPHNKHTSDMPESNTGRLSFFWDVRHRHVHCRGCPIASTSEEALLWGTSSMLHNFGHLLQDWGLNGVDLAFNNRVITLFDMAKAEGLYQGRYAGSDQVEYWAEGVGSWFNSVPSPTMLPTRG